MKPNHLGYKIRQFVKIKIFVFIISFFFLFKCTTEQPRQRPNIVLILADDLGTEVLGCYGGTSYQTPHIDQLAQTGQIYNHCYSSPVCSPSRVNLLTGRYGFRTGQDWGHLPDNEITFAHILQDAGYKTAIAGKWQMAVLKDSPQHIAQSGFQESCVFGWHEGPRYYEPLIYQNGKIQNDIQNQYGPDIYSQFLIDFINANHDHPFLAFYSMALTHEISNDLETPPPTGPLGRYQTYQELVEYADILVGKLVAALDTLHLREKTLIIFTADNGTPYHFITRYEDGEYIREPVYSAMGDSLIRGGKGFMTDAGTHVPLIVNWKGVTKPKSSNVALIDFSDFLPTFVELAGIKMPTGRIFDGKSFLPAIMENQQHIRDWVYVQWNDVFWLRNQYWKLYNNDQLYHMVSDPSEERPIYREGDSQESASVRSYFTKTVRQLRNEEAR